LAAWNERVSERAVTRKWLPIAFWLSVSALLVGLVSLSRERAKLYLDPIALWSDAAARSRQKTRPLINLGTLLAQNGRLSEARRAEAHVRDVSCQSQPQRGAVPRSHGRSPGQRRREARQRRLDLAGQGQSPCASHFQGPPLQQRHAR